MLFILCFWNQELDSLFWGHVAATNPSPEFRPPDTVLCIVWNKYPKRYLSIKTSKFNHSFSRQSLFKSNTVTRFSLLQRSVTSKKVQRNGKPSWVNCFLLKVVKPRRLFHFIITFYVAFIIVTTDNEKMFAVVLCQCSAKQRESENQHTL